MRKKLSLIIVSTFLLSIIFTMQVFATENTKTVKYNTYNMGNIAINYQGHYYVPMREFCEQVHYKVKYDTNTKDITVYDNRDKVTLSSSGTLTKNGNVVAKNMTSIVRKGKTYIPAIFFSKGLGFEVQNNKNSLDIFGVTMYKFDENYSNDKDEVILRMYTKNGEYGQGKIDITMPVVLDSAFTKRAKSANFDLTSYNKYRNDKVKIKEVYRTPLNNDIVDFYKYNGDNVIPLLTTVIFSNDTSRPWDAFRMHSNIGLVYSSVDILKPTSKDIEYYKKSIADRNNTTDGMYAFIDSSNNFQNAGVKASLTVYSDESMTIPGAFNECYTTYHKNIPSPTHKTDDMIIRIDSINKNLIQYTVRTLDDATGKEHIGKISFVNEGSGNQYKEVIQY